MHFLIMKYNKYFEEETNLVDKISNKLKWFSKVNLIAILVVTTLFFQCKKNDFNGETTGLCPVVVTTNPLNNSTGVAINKKVAVTFNEDMNANSINASTFYVQQGTTIILGSISTSGTTSIFTAASNFNLNTTYTAIVTTNVRDVAGNALVNDYVWTFTTGTSADISVPVVTSTDPVNAATAVPLNKKVITFFNKSMNPQTINAATFLLKQGTNSILGVVSYSGNSAVFTPSTNLATNTNYTATITTGAQDVSGNALAANFIWNFTTGTITDIVSPTVTSTDPINNATAVSLNKNASAIFNKTMNPSTINSLSYTLKQGITNIVGAVSYSGVTATFTPSSNLQLNTTYTATITTDAKDIAGNALANNYTWSFTTGTSVSIGGIDLGSAGNFALLAGSGITNTGNSIITGDIGTSPTGTVNGFPPGIVIGTIHAANPIAAQGKIDLTTAFNDAQARSTGAISLPGDLSGLTFAPGLYSNSTSVMLSAGNVTIDAKGDANAVFIFKMGSTLTTLPGTGIILSGGAQAKNIYWSVGTSATLGTNSIFYGNILADQSISLNTGATLYGRALTRIAAVTLQGNSVNKP